MRISFKVGGAIVSCLISATTFAFNAFNIFPTISWSWIALISFLIFSGFVFWGWYGSENRARKLEYARPSIVFDQYSPSSSILSPMMKRAFFTRIAFSNNVASPTGDNSIAQKLSAIIKIIKDKQVIDTWDGRWASSNEPRTPSDVWLANTIDLPANTQQAILDIGYRLDGEKVFVGWDNTHYVAPPQRVSIKPGNYKLRITLGASNMDYREFVFKLNIPDEPQTNKSHVVTTFVPSYQLD